MQNMGLRHGKPAIKPDVHTKKPFGKDVPAVKAASSKLINFSGSLKRPWATQCKWLTKIKNKIFKIKLYLP